MKTISFDKKKGLFILSTKDSTYVFGINKDRTLRHVYYGPKKMAFPKKKAASIGYHDSSKLPNLMPELDLYDGHNVFENTLKITSPGNIHSLDCVYSGHKAAADGLCVYLKDRVFGLVIELHYKVIHDHNLIEKHINIKNTSGSEIFRVETFYSGSMSLPAGNYKLGYLHGKWAGEFSLICEEINYGKKVLESRTGNSSHIFNPSMFITDSPGLSESKGNYYSCQLLWSGNHKITVEKRLHGVVAVQCGANDFDSSFELKPGAEFATPVMLLGFSGKGLGMMSRQLHDHFRSDVMPAENRGKVPPIPANTWEGIYFDISSSKVKKLADLAARAGAEALMIDDGWFKGRNNDKTSLGDWETDMKKFPEGLERMGDYIKSCGMKFGVWLEPEMISPKSKLYKVHPDWAYNYKPRKNTQMRNQLVLNITKKEVKEYIRRVFDRVINKYGAEFIKWDMNRYISDAGADNIGTGTTVWIEHTRALYELMAYLRSLKPGIILEGCAGGGGRFDGGILKYADALWTSDMTDALQRQYIQYGASLFYPASVMESHVSDIPNSFTKRDIPLKYRLHTSMAANFGIQADLLKWTKEGLEVLKCSIEMYKNIRDMIFFGNMYRLASPYSGGISSVLYASKDGARAVVFIFGLGKKTEGTVKLQGLKKDKVYKVEEDGIIKDIKGSVLIGNGISYKFGKQYTSRMIVLK
jgi:alpha-galactosidase